MNKFLNKNVKPVENKTSDRVIIREGKAEDFVNECESAWASLETVRSKMRRSIMYAYEDQWGDYVKDNFGMVITEGELIKREGKVPLKNNMISPILKNIDGQFRSNITQTICSVRDQSESKIGDMVSIALEYVHDLNETDELDSYALRELMLSAVVAQQVEYGWNPTKRMNDVWIRNVNTSRLFFNTNIEDIRAWDMDLIGEVYDMKLENVVSLFSQSKEDKDKIESIYGKYERKPYVISNGMQGEESKNIDFYSPTRPDLCRVIFGWKLESREAYKCHDLLKGTWFFVPLKDKKKIDDENSKRTSDALNNGVAKEDILLIEYSYTNESYWYYRYVTPWGDVLQEGESPYWHESHNYVIQLYTMIQGHLFNFIENFIDQQRMINRTITVIDFIRGASAKGLIVADNTAFEGISEQKIVDEYVKYNGVLFCKLKAGQKAEDVIHQFNASSTTAGDVEMLNLELKLINDIAGINSAMQGGTPPAGTASSLYSQQIEQSSLNLKGLFESFKMFRKRRDYKVVQTIQQYYDSPRYINIAGHDYEEESKMYNPDKVQNVQIDLQIEESTNTPTYQSLENDFLMTLYKSGAIDDKILLENSSYAFSSKILESINNNEAKNQQAGVSQDVMNSVAQQSKNPNLIKLMNNDSMASEDDGQIRKSN